MSDSMTQDDRDDRIRARAHELWVLRLETGQVGTAESDWLEAETDISAEDEEVAEETAGGGVFVTL